MENCAATEKSGEQKKTSEPACAEQKKNAQPPKRNIAKTSKASSFSIFLINFVFQTFFCVVM